MKPLTPREQETLTIIKDYYSLTKEIPTHAYVASKLSIGLDRRSATVHIKSLINKGYLKKTSRYGMYNIIIGDN
jgi:Mn-dependent DtxR family transcriptional regulator